MKKLITLFVAALFPIAAHSEVLWDLEYLPKDLYESAIGTGIYQIKPSGVGFYGNFQMTLTQREPHYDTLNTSSFGDPVVETFKDLMILNIGITKQLGQYAAIYAGAGYASVTGVARKYDPMHILGENGDYYVDEPAYDDSGANINAGLIFKYKKLGVNFGYQSFPKIPYAGIGMVF